MNTISMHCNPQNIKLASVIICSQTKYADSNPEFFPISTTIFSHIPHVDSSVPYNS